MTYYATVTSMPTTAVLKSASSIQAWKLPWTDDDNADLKLKTVSGTLTIKNKVVNHAGNTWYEIDTGSSTRGFVYGPSITLLPYYTGVDETSVGADNAAVVGTCNNPGGLTLKTGGFYLSTKLNAATYGTKKTDNIPSSYQTAATIPCSYNFKNEYGLTLTPGTTYYYVLYVTDSSGKSYYSEEYSFTTTSTKVTGVSISPAGATVNLGGTQQLAATVTPSNATNKSVTWKSSNTAVATVSSSGLVTAKGLGSATITATAADGSGKAASVTITVTCNHSAGTNTVAAVAPTCTTSGLTEGKTCKACGATVTAQTTVAATGHSYTSVVTAPTCTERGYTTYTCACGDSYTGNEIAATGHSWGNWTSATAGTETRTCSGCGETESRECAITGTCGDNLTWGLDSGTGILTISGNGTMADYTYSNAAPWKQYKATIKEVVVNGGVTSIGSCAFMGLTELNTATISKGVVTIGDGAFSGCTQLTNIVLPDGITSMGCETFYECSKLTSVTIPAGVKELEDAVFQECTRLKEIVLPASLVRVRDGAFSGCSSLDNVYYRGTSTQKKSITISGGNTPLKNADWTYNFCSLDSGGDPASHSYGSWTQTKAPTCTATGTERRECENCDHYETRGVAAIGHEYSTVIIEATCTEDGYTIYTCDTCGDAYGDDPVPALGHDVVDGICDRCGEVILKIVMQLVDVTVAPGETAAVTVGAEGDGLTYTWYYRNPGSTGFSKTTAFTGNTYSVTMSEARSGRQVYCIVADAHGNSVQTDTVTLSMKAADPVTIVSQSKSVWVPEGEKAVVTVNAVGDGLTYKWYYKNPGASKYSYTSSFTGNTYSVTMNEERSGRYVYCKITDAYGNTVKSKTVSVNMQTPLEIITQPKSVRVAEGATAKVTVKAQGDGLTYKWYYKNPGATKYSYTSSFTGSSYSITMNDSRDGRYVFCRVYDKYGNMVKTNTVSLRMK